mmetsp:Transcript_10426/g.21448  ORF Transcript_10426/g.21448 Transcript_10426/m.21448 type:complete len:423 (-) Transcript_10426:44-1312(-)
MSDLNATVVDFGSSSLKVGHSGDATPRVFLNSSVGVKAKNGSLKNEDDPFIFSSRKHDIITDLTSAPVSTPLMNPYNGGDLDLRNGGDSLMVKVFDLSMNQMFQESSSASEHPLLFIDRCTASPEQRTKLAEIFFETCKVPALYLGRDAVMSCYACGKSTGVVVNIGGSSTTVTPVFEGWAEDSIRSPVGGNFMDDHFLSILDKKAGKPVLPSYLAKVDSSKRSKVINDADSSYHAYMRMVAGRYAKEMLAKVASFGYSPTSASHETLIKQTYSLPDGTSVDIGTERYETGEVLFGRESITRSQLVDDTFGSADPVQNLVCDAVFACPRDQQASLLSTVILSGGGSCVPGIVDRLRLETENIIHAHTPGWRVKVLAPGTTERRICSWLGGSIVASLSGFSENWMTKKEYEEQGAAGILRKCP